MRSISLLPKTPKGKQTTAERVGTEIHFRSENLRRSGALQSASLIVIINSVTPAKADKKMLFVVL